MEDDIRKHLQPQADRSVANPPREVGPNRPNVIEGEFQAVQATPATGIAPAQPQEAAEATKEAKPKIGAGHMAAMGRLGLKELASALPAFPAGHHIIEEPGLAGNLTPGEVASNKQESTVHGKGQDANQEPNQAASVPTEYERQPLPPMPGQEQGRTRGKGR